LTNGPYLAPQVGLEPTTLAFLNGNVQLRGIIHISTYIPEYYTVHSFVCQPLFCILLK